MTRVRMTHPDVEQDIVVGLDAEPIHANSGWRRAPGQDDLPPPEGVPADVVRFEGQEQVRMRHPNVAEVITVGAAAVPFHAERGWVRVDQAERESLEAKTVDQLKDEIRKLNADRDDDDQLPVSGTKAELLERLSQAQTSEVPAAPAEQEDEA
jgi:hypothetical protein